MRWWKKGRIKLSGNETGGKAQWGRYFRPAQRRRNEVKKMGRHGWSIRTGSRWWTWETAWWISRRLKKLKKLFREQQDRSLSWTFCLTLSIWYDAAPSMSTTVHIAFINLSFSVVLSWLLLVNFMCCVCCWNGLHCGTCITAGHSSFTLLFCLEFMWTIWKHRQFTLVFTASKAACRRAQLFVSGRLGDWKFVCVYVHWVF
jgi:hypothetical protein